MTMQEFIRENQTELIEIINPSKEIRADVEWLYEELELWIANDEDLYNWAQSEGVDI